MKKFLYQASAIGLICFSIGQMAIAQPAVPPPPPPKGEPSEKNEQTEIVIRQKGGKDTKLTLEVKNGQYFINGKPLDKFEDNEIIVEKRDINEDLVILPNMSFSPSPFRMNEEDRRRMEIDIQNEQRNVQNEFNNVEVQRQLKKAMKIRTNAAFLGVSSKKTDKGGATVLEVTKGSPAEKAGIKAGDVITKVNDSSISNPEDLYETIHNYKVGDKVKITFLRQGKTQAVTATLEKSDYATKGYYNYNFDYKMPPMPPMPEMDGLRAWGTPAPKLGIKAQDAEDGKGVAVLEVQDSSAASRAGIKKGDIILQFDGSDVNGTNELVDQIMEARKKNIVKMKVQRGSTTQDIDIKIPRKLKTAEL